MRRLLKLATILSLSICVATAALWLWSIRKPRAVQFWSPRGLWEVAAHDGKIWLDNEPQRELDRGAITALERSFKARTRELRAATAGLRDIQASDSSFTEARARVEQAIRINQMEMSWAASVPPYQGGSLRCVSVVSAAAVLPLLWVIAAIVRGSKRRPECCPVCFYDLTGNTSGVCPECGNNFECRQEAT